MPWDNGRNANNDGRGSKVDSLWLRPPTHLKISDSFKIIFIQIKNENAKQNSKN